MVNVLKSCVLLFSKSLLHSSFGWYDESTAFESIDVPHSAYREIDDWRDLNAWDGGRKAEHSEASIVFTVVFEMFQVAGFDMIF